MKMLRRIGVACAAACAAACALALAAVPLVPALADTAAPSTVVDFGPFLHDVVMPLAVALVGVGVTWLGARANTWLGLQSNSQLGGVIEVALQNGLAFAQSRLAVALPAGQPIPVDVKNQILATAANYALAHVPDALKMLGVDQATLLQKLEARLSLNTTPAAASIAVPTDPATVKSAG